MAHAADACTIEILQIWREGDSPNDSEFVSNSRGLFPSPSGDHIIGTEAGIKHCNTFKVLGTVVAKALIDSRIIDIPFNELFIKLVLDQHVPMTIDSIRVLDLTLAKSLEHLERYLHERTAIESIVDITDEDKEAATSAIEIDGVSIEDLALDFTLPGYGIELKENGRDITVNVANLKEYLALVIEWTLNKGIEPMVQKFKEGFSEVRTIVPWLEGGVLS